MPKYHIITYGCQMNKSDSERIATVLEKIGYKKASKENEADLIVANMCSVRQSAVDRVYGLTQKLKKLKTKKSKIKTILTGCILKSDRKKFSKKFDLILNIKSLPKWPKILERKTFVRLKPGGKYYQGCKSDLEIQPKYQSNFSAFIPISNGCNFNCSYCVIPFTRGKLVCRDHKEILKEAKNVIKKEFKEIRLLGQNVNDYHSPTDNSINFAKLLETINEISGNFWIRFTSPHPKNFSDELIKTMVKCEKITPYLNLPVQSGDDEILKKMRRPYTIKEYKNLIRKIRNAFKKHRKGLEEEVAISTDIIVGFPGETEKQFENTVKLFKEIEFDMAYIAEYSPRPQTTASKLLKDNVSKKEKGERRKFLTEILKGTALKKNKKIIGKEIEVLINKKRDGSLFGKSRHYKTVKIQSPNFKKLIGQFVKVKIIDATCWGLKGELKSL